MDILRTFAKENKISINEKQIAEFTLLAELLVNANKEVNLTAITDPKDIEIKHMIDSLESGRFILDNTEGMDSFRIVDVGCGAGFPGLPLKILFKNADITLLDSLNKKINFVNQAIKKLELKNARGIAMRAEDFAQTDNRENYDFCTSRAVARMNVLLEYCLPLVKIGGYCLVYKSADCEDELKEAETAIRILGGEVADILRVNLPDEAGKRNIVIIKKIKTTPAKYPRKAGKPSKCPIV